MWRPQFPRPILAAGGFAGAFKGAAGFKGATKGLLTPVKGAKGAIRPPAIPKVAEEEAADNSWGADDDSGWGAEDDNSWGQDDENWGQDENSWEGDEEGGDPSGVAAQAAAVPKTASAMGAVPKPGMSAVPKALVSKGLLKGGVVKASGVVASTDSAQDGAGGWKGKPAKGGLPNVPKAGPLFGKAMAGLNLGKGKGGKGTNDSVNSAMLAVLQGKGKAADAPPAEEEEEEQEEEKDEQGGTWQWRDDNNGGGDQGNAGKSKGKGKDKGGKGKGKDIECFRCGGPHVARDCPDGDDKKGKGKKGSKGSKSTETTVGSCLEPEHAFDLVETIGDITTVGHLEGRDRIMLGRALEARLTNQFFQEWLGKFPTSSMPRQQLQLALNTNLWGFSRAQRCSLIEELSGRGFSFPNWKEKSDSLIAPVKKGSGKGKRRRKGEDKEEGGKGGRKGKRGGKKRGRRGEVLDPDDPFNDQADGKTGANTIEVKWKPPGAKDSDEEDDEEDEDDEYDEDGEDNGNWWNETEPKKKKAKVEKKKSLSPVRGPAGRGRGSLQPAWKVLGVGNTSAPEPEAPKAPSGPAGRGRGTSMPSWMTKGVSDEKKPEIPGSDDEKEVVGQGPNILDSIFEERDSSAAASFSRGGFASRTKRGKGGGKDKDRGKDKGDKGDKGKKSDDRGKGKNGKRKGKPADDDDDDDDERQDAEDDTEEAAPHPPSGTPGKKGNHKGSIRPLGKGKPIESKGSPRPPMAPPPGLKGGIRPGGSVAPFLRPPGIVPPTMQAKRQVDEFDL